MDISLNIKEVLEKNDRVILPGLGSFYKKRLEGFFDETQEVFYPPKETIAFTNSFDTEEENPIINYICEVKNVSAASAKYILDKYTEELKTDLNEKGQIELAGLGTLIQEDGLIRFELDQSIITNLSFFGLPSLNLQEKITQPVVAPAVTEEKPEETFSLAEQALSTASTNNTEDTSQRNYKWLYYVIPVVLLCAALIYLKVFLPDQYNSIFNPNLNNKDVKTVLPVGIPKQNANLSTDSITADSVYNEIEKNAKAEGLEIEKAKDSTDVTINGTAVPKKNTIRYEIIIAAWRTMAKAEDNLKKLKANGFDAHIVEDADGPMIKISVATLYNKAQAEKELRRIQEELNPEAFIKPIKPLN